MHNSQQNKSKKSYLYPTVKLSSDLKSKKSQEEIQKNVEEFQKIRFIQSNFHQKINFSQQKIDIDIVDYW